MEKHAVRARGIRLLKRGRLGFFRVLFSRVGLITLMLLLQIALLLVAFLALNRYLPQLIAVQSVFVAVMVLYLLNSEHDPSSKVTWLVFIMITPIFGTRFLFFTQMNFGHRRLGGLFRAQVEKTRYALSQDEQTVAALKEADPSSAGIARYLARTGCFPVYRGCNTQYFRLGEDMFDRIMEEMAKAEHFIFLEFFIIQEGQMLGEMLELLSRKAAEGVEVRLIYDGMNEFFFVPRDYPKKLEQLGIRCKVFAPLRPFLSTHYNYRDHRKILVIDGHTAFTGGVNLADRYINLEEVFGHWKDTGLMIRGEAARSFTLMFLQNWNMTEKEPTYEPYLHAEQAAEPSAGDGFVIPYASSPLERSRAGEMVYIDILNRAQRYVHIMTPYLILDGELETALCFAAERGVEVSIIMPGVPDKKMPYALAKTFYPQLMRAGVKIYEYTPGFVHAKCFVSDDCRAVVGTINLDYRSLYHHFECAAYLYGTEAVRDVESDFQATAALCHEVKPRDLRNLNVLTRLSGVLLKAAETLL